MTDIWIYPLTILATILLEFPVYWVFRRENPLALLQACAAINLATVPMANLAFSYAPGWLLPIEMLVMLVEAFPIHWLLQQGYRRALLISIAANGFSTLSGIAFWLI
jgi:hypothetical protein